MEDSSKYCQGGCGNLAKRELGGYCSVCFSITSPTKDPDTESQKKEIGSAKIKSSHKCSPRKRLLSKSRGKTCAFCNKRITLIEGEMKCACGGTFCTKHQFSKDHNCHYDYRSDASKKIEKSNPKVTSEKVTKF